MFALAIVLAGTVGRLISPYVRSTTLVTRQLPGFTLAVPHGRIVKDEIDYGRGMFMISVDGKIIVGASWTPSDGEPFTPDEMKVMAQIFASGVGKMPQGTATPTKTSGPDGKPLDGLQIGDDMWLTMVPCGARQIVVTTMAAHAGEKLHRRVVASFVCAPDAAKEATVKQGGSALVLDLPGWFATERTPDRMQISDGNAMVSLQSVPANIETDVIEKVFAPIMKSQNIVANFSPPKDGRVAFTMKIDGQNAYGWARVFHCATASEAMMVFAETDAIAQSLWARVGNARCRKPGEAAQAWPDAPTPPAPAPKRSAK